MFAFVQIGLIIVVMVIIISYLTRKQREEKPRDELSLRAQFYQEEAMNFIRRLKSSPNKTLKERLKLEIERFHQTSQLDELLEKAEKEKNTQRAIDYYLEAMTFIMKNNFETERKPEIEEKIKTLQGQPRSQAYSSDKR